MWETASRVQIPFSPPLIPSNNIYFVKKYKFNLYLSLVFISVKTQFKKKLIEGLGNSYVFAERFFRFFGVFYKIKFRSVGHCLSL